ncbi:MAG: hypothetical protein QMD85_00245 [Candidatus Aenigmarchaeota archaeon]|nr:hypothetical protein [Candidatus Aenigmarchaeota archaeon]MDI6721957.1 hypothetical protein [Candidatus Aenigmarchaeota archaeon]
MVPLGKIFSKAWHYALDLKRIMVFFLLFVPFVVIFTAFLDSEAEILVQFASFAVTGIMPQNLVVGFSSFIILLITTLVIVSLIGIYAAGVIIENAKIYYTGKKVPLKKSMPAMKGRFLSLLGAVLITKIILAGLGSVPFIGFVFIIVLSWVFLVVMQSVVVSKKGTFDAIKESYSLFMSRKLDTFVFWLLIAVFAAVLTLLAFVPLLIASWPILAKMFTLSPVSLIELIRASLPQLFVAGLITSFILAFAQVFKESVTTFFYIEAKKKRR